MLSKANRFLLLVLQTTKKTRAFQDTTGKLFSTFQTTKPPSHEHALTLRVQEEFRKMKQTDLLASHLLQYIDLNEFYQLIKEPHLVEPLTWIFNHIRSAERKEVYDLLMENKEHIPAVFNVLKQNGDLFPIGLKSCDIMDALCLINREHALAKTNKPYLPLDDKEIDLQFTQEEEENLRNFFKCI